MERRVLSVEEMLAPYADPHRRQRRVRELATLLGAFLAAAELRALVDALAALARWVAEPDARLPLPAGESAPAHRRLTALVQLLEQPALQAAVRSQVAALIGQCDALPLLADSGLPNDRGLLHESADRLFGRILPAPRDDRDLAALLTRLFPTRRSLLVLEGLPPALFLRLGQALAGPGVFDPLEGAVRDAFLLVAARVQGLGLSQPIRARSRPGPLPRSPFFALPRAGDRVLAELGQPGESGASYAWQTAIDGCREELRGVLAHLELTGISVDVVYEIELIEQALGRLHWLSALLVAAPGPSRVAAAFELLLVLVRARLADRSLYALAYTSLHLLARNLVERAGRTGEHYITVTRREYWQMLGRAAGAGLFTLGTAALKVRIAGLHLALFLEGLASGINYALSFALMQLCGFTLATKQPSMTAATLAGSIGADEGPDRLAELVTQAARIVRSQLCAAVGNVTTVAAAAVAFDELYRARTGHPFLTAEKASAVVASLHPLRSGTIWYATVTGVILWVSSLAGGWVENFAVYRQLPRAIAEHRLGRLFGRRLMGWLSEAFARNVSGYAGSVALGLMLGMTPALGAFFGLPLDVRHVTLSTGTLALALATGDFVLPPGAPAAMLGIAIIFVLNLGVSFGLALAVALRARQVPRRARWALFLAIARRFFRRPQEFLLPPRS
jgi:site-specific recombinase